MQFLKLINSLINREGAIFGIGNPLLDICAPVDYDYLKKWGLEPNSAILAEDKHKKLPEEIEKLFPVKFLAGGSAQNTLRVAQWVLKKKVRFDKLIVLTKLISK